MLKIGKNSASEHYVYEGTNSRTVWFTGSPLQCNVFKEAVETLRDMKSDFNLKELIKWVQETNLELIEEMGLPLHFYWKDKGIFQTKQDKSIERNIRRLL